MHLCKFCKFPKHTACVCMRWSPIRRRRRLTTRTCGKGCNEGYHCTCFYLQWCTIRAPARTTMSTQITLLQFVPPTTLTLTCAGKICGEPRLLAVFKSCMETQFFVQQAVGDSVLSLLFLQFHYSINDCNSTSASEFKLWSYELANTTATKHTNMDNNYRLWVLCVHEQ